MNSDLLSIANLFYFIGLGSYAYGSTKYRLPGAPIAFNGPRGWPWQHQDWFAPRGRIYRKIGLTLVGVGLILLLLAVLPIW